METLFIPNENDFKRWIKEAVKEYFQDTMQSELTLESKDDALLTEKKLQSF